jgi:hypothetical protein
VTAVWPPPNCASTCFYPPFLLGMAALRVYYCEERTWLDGRCGPAARLCFYLSFIMGVAALVLIWLLYPKDFDYTGGIADNVTYFKVRSARVLRASFAT